MLTDWNAARLCQFAMCRLIYCWLFCTCYLKYANCNLLHASCFLLPSTYFLLALPFLLLLLILVPKIKENSPHTLITNWKSQKDIQKEILTFRVRLHTAKKTTFFYLKNWHFRVNLSNFLKEVSQFIYISLWHIFASTMIVLTGSNRVKRAQTESDRENGVWQGRQVL